MTTTEKLKHLCKVLEISREDFAKMFGYKNANVFNNSTRKEKVINGSFELFQLIGQKQTEFFNLES